MFSYLRRRVEGAILALAFSLVLFGNLSATLAAQDYSAAIESAFGKGDYLVFVVRADATGSFDNDEIPKANLESELKAAFKQNKSKKIVVVLEAGFRKDLLTTIISLLDSAAAGSGLIAYDDNGEFVGWQK